MLVPPVHSDAAAPTARPQGVRTSCRIYAALVAALQVVLIAAMFLQGVRISVYILAIFGLVLIGALLLACNQSIGRVILIPPAILQILLAGILGLLNVFGIVAGYLSQSGSVTFVSALYTAGCALSVLYLGVAIFLFTFFLRKN